MAEKIESFEKKEEEINIEFSGKELAYALVNIRNSIKDKEAIEKERQKYLKDIIKSPVFNEEHIESLKQIEKKLDSSAPEYIDKNITLGLSHLEAGQLLIEVEQRLSSLKTDIEMKPFYELAKGTQSKEGAEDERDKKNKEEINTLEKLKLKLEVLIDQKSE